MNTPPIVSPQEWLAARKELLVKEKEGSIVHTLDLPISVADQLPSC